MIPLHDGFVDHLTDVHRYDKGMIQTVGRRHNWLYPPPWFVRTVKLLGLAVSLVLFVLLIVLTADKASQPAVVALPDTTFDYVQRLALCRHVHDAPWNSSDHVTLDTYEACRKLDRLERYYYSRRLRAVNVFNFSFVISGRRICNRDTEIVLLIHSRHDYGDRRTAIRKTWGGAAVEKRWPGRQIPKNVRIAFVLGLHNDSVVNYGLVQENDEYGDIIQGNFLDSYGNMTLKSLLGLKWVSTYCSKVDYVIKSDDDMIINFPHLLSILRRTDMTWSIMGALNVGAKVYRSTTKWALSKTDFPFYYFPPYESGSAYVISGDLVLPLLQCSDYVPHIFIDDVYITGILGKILEVRHKREEGFAYWTDKRPEACDVITDRIVTGTKMDPRHQYSIWKDITNSIVC